MQGVNPCVPSPPSGPDAFQSPVFMVPVGPALPPSACGMKGEREPLPRALQDTRRRLRAK